MLWHILGAGALGLRFADLLRPQGAEIELILRNAQQLQQYQTAGSQFTVLDPDTARKVPAAASLAAASTPIRHLLVCTKAFDARAALHALAHRLGPDTQIVLLLNGYGAQQQIATELPGFPVWAASTTSGANRPAPFTTRLAGRGTTLIGALTPRANGLPGLWSSLDEVQAVADIDQVLWQKLAINCCINPLTLIYDCPNGELATRPDARTHLERIAGEVEQVTALAGKTLFDEPLAERAVQVARSTATNISSMLQDHRAGRRTEIEQITGALCALAQSLHCPVPVNQQLLEQLRRS